jgi:hypothetical protein
MCEQEVSFSVGIETEIGNCTQKSATEMDWLFSGFHATRYCASRKEEEPPEKELLNIHRNYLVVPALTMETLQMSTRTILYYL